MKLTLVTTGGGKFEGREMAEWEVHKAGCADVKRMRTMRAVNYIEDYEAESPEALVDEVVSYFEEDQGWGKDDFRIMPCAKKAV